MANLFEIHSLSASYGTNVVLQDVDFKVSENDFIGIIGRAIIGNPKLLLLDEPGNFVDTTFENDFYEKLRDLNKRMAILMVSHDVGTISSHIKSFACVNRSLHYHPSHEITNEDLLAYGCPIQLVTHGDVPHTVLKYHE
jgi:zinc transport system ATP-binding protein